MHWEMSIFITLNLYLHGVQVERRIFLGKQPITDRRFVVYIIKSKPLDFADNWLCGGAIVSPRHVLTSAACLLEDNYMYVIAGYRKYVRPDDLEDDECTRAKKQRIIKICVPFGYLHNFKNYTHWGDRDIGVATVETPYDFSDHSYRLFCDYVPNKIRINYRPLSFYKDTYEYANAMIYGWGHTFAYREPEDTGDYNSQYLLEAPIKIYNMTQCIATRPLWNASDFNKNYMLCAMFRGELDGEGNKINPKIGSRENECNDQFRRKGSTGDCANFDFNYMDGLVIRRDLQSRSTKDTASSNNTRIHKETKNDERKSYYTSRKQGICQNDHGTPLVVWIGSEQMVVGVAVIGKIGPRNVCNFPSLFTSTYCVSGFLRCVLAFELNLDSRRFCNAMQEEGYSMQEVNITWPTDMAGKTTPKGNIARRQATPKTTNGFGDII